MLLGLAAATVGSVFANPPNQNYTISGNTPGFVKNVKDLGAVDPSTIISVTVWLKLHNEGQLDSLAKAQTQTGNASYHKWISQGQFNATYAPTSQELNSTNEFRRCSLVDGQKSPRPALQSSAGHGCAHGC